MENFDIEGKSSFGLEIFSLFFCCWLLLMTIMLLLSPDSVISNES